MSSPKRFLILALTMIIAGFFSASCDNVQSNISITGEVGVGSDLPSYESTYHLAFYVKNEGQSQLEFSAVNVVWLPGEQTKGLSTLLIQRGGRIFRIAPGETQRFEADTDGYTSDIFLASGGKPIRFAAEVLQNGKRIAGPFVTTLPPLKDIPAYYDKNIAAEMTRVHLPPLPRLDFLYADIPMPEWGDEVRAKTTGLK